MTICIPLWVPLLAAGWIGFGAWWQARFALTRRDQFVVALAWPFLIGWAVVSVIAEDFRG
jgi:hypothetical protein